MNKHVHMLYVCICISIVPCNSCDGEAAVLDFVGVLNHPLNAITLRLIELKWYYLLGPILWAKLMFEIMIC